MEVTLALRPNLIVYISRPLSISSVLVLRLDVEHVFHVELEGLGTTGANHSTPFVNFKPTPGWKKKRLVNDLEKKSDDLTSVSDEEVVEVVVCVGVF